ncbi:TraR/DksA family transcriptional regulator [Rhodothermus profundi]|uniref:Transcriptional regulator, TraR/DksA family n=1 Tax=Rhodothermus profundi TaxID=633813 RepID=A0A1M6PT10_9BACT|nr:TraR/DksA C4-type zinc finger protein [Rhodothermus profundi]SHK11154.1 transcriptional regulator, TraR/DksA family [Rhodothermus profundi]
MAEKHEHNATSNQKTSAQEPEKTEPVRRTPFTDEELEYFRQLILERRRQAVEDIERMKAQLEDAREQGGTDTAYSFHMADAGTDAMEREKLFLMIARQQKYISHLDRALERIKNKTYGICKVTGKPIPRERLEAVPHTEVSIEAKLKQKK